MNRYQDIVGRINYGLFLSVIALLPFPQTPLRFTCVLWIITWFLEGRWLQKTNYQLPFILFGLWFLGKIVSGLWAPDQTAWSWQIERYLAFGLMVPIGIWGVNKYYRWETAGKVLIATCVAAVPLYLVWLLALYHHPQWTEWMPLTEPWVHHTDIRVFIAENISHFKHRLFLCSVELTGAVVACLLYGRRWKVLLPVLAVMLSAIPLTGSRQAILTTIALLAVAILYALPKRHRWIYTIGIVLTGLLIGFGMMKYHPRMQHVTFKDISEARQLSYDHDIRLNIWGAALQHPSDYIAHGLGAGQSANYLGERYEDVHFDYYAAKKFHAHNQYLEELMELGIGGLILFLLAWISIPLCTKKGKLFALLFTTLFAFNMFTDCMFGKFDGIALWAVCMLLLFLQSDAQSDEQSPRDA